MCNATPSAGASGISTPSPATAAGQQGQRPPAVVRGQSQAAGDRGEPPPFICIPLYIYPAPSAWDPLFAAARANPSARFHAIVNPSNGPGDSALPDESYLAALRALAALPNVTVLGYVHVSYGSRPAADVRRDIATYAAWRGRGDDDASSTAAGAGGLRVDGIFFDEAPSDGALTGYVGELSRFARGALAEANGKPGLVMLNPGVVVDREYYDLADYVVAFEQSLRHWATVKRDVMTGVPGAAARAKTVVMVHSCRVGDRELARLARGFNAAGIGGQFVTEQLDGGYSRWPSWWEKYVDHVFGVEGGDGKKDSIGQSEKCQAM